MFRLAVIMLCANLSAAALPLYLAQVELPRPDDHSYPVSLNDHVVAYVRTGFKSWTAEERANALSERIERYARDAEFQPELIAVEDTELSTDIVSRDKIVMSVLDADAAIEGRTRQELAEDLAVRVRNAIEQYRRDMSYENIVRAVLLTLLATLLLIAILFLIQRFHRAAQEAALAWANAKMESSTVNKYRLVRLERVKSCFAQTARFLRLILILFLLYSYTGMVLSFFPWTRGFSGHLLDLVWTPIKVMAIAFVGQLPNLFFVAVLVVITRSVLKFMRSFLSGVENGTIPFSGFYPEWAAPTYRIVRLLVLAFAAVIAYPHIPGSDSEAFKGISIFLGILVSLGSTSLIANVVSGLSMTYMRAFKVGDRVRIADFVGEVMQTRLQVTHIRTPKNEIISVPNSMIINSHVTNYSSLAKESGLILHTIVGIGYDAPWRQVRAMLLMAAERTPGLLTEPKAYVLQKSLTDFCVTYELNAHTYHPQYMERIYSDLHKNILDVFNEYEVQIMTPNYEGDRASPAIVPKSRWYAAPADRFADQDEPSPARLDGNTKPAA